MRWRRMGFARKRQRWEVYFHQKGAKLNARASVRGVGSFPLSGPLIRTRKGVKTTKGKSFNSRGRHQKAVTGEMAAPKLVKPERFSSRRRLIRGCGMTC